VRISLFTSDIANNSLGRTYSLWLLCEHLQWDAQVYYTGPTAIDEIWAPLKGTAFAEHCQKYDESSQAQRATIKASALIVAAKPHAPSFGVAMRVASNIGKPVLLDVDDPDIEVQLSWERPLRRAARALIRREAISSAKLMRKMMAGVPTIVSNPVLQSRWGGEIIPHARTDSGPGRPHALSTPTIAFVGTDHPHKGLATLRRALERNQGLGYRLVVTDDEPSDSRPWEDWIGQTTLAAGLNVVANSDVVILPSKKTVIANGQLPAKLMDAMLFGRAIAVSDLKPMTWALDGAGRVFPPGSVAGLTEILHEFSDPSIRKRIGDSARERALSMFTVESLAPAFALACHSAVGSTVL